MAYLLDSNIVIPYLADDPEAVSLVERLASDGIAISIVTYMEVYQGTLRSPGPEHAQALFEHFLAVVPILPLSLAVSRRCARLREALKGRGRRVRDRALDLIIAATPSRQQPWNTAFSSSRTTWPTSGTSPGLGFTSLNDPFDPPT